MKSTLLPILLLLLSVYSIALNAHPFLYDLKTNYESSPLAVDPDNILFSWKMGSEVNARNLEQTDYQLKLWDDSGNLIWDSGKQKSGLSHFVKYQGPQLAFSQRFLWELTVWTNTGDVCSSAAFFETCLPKSFHEGWENAQWIGGGEHDMMLYSHYLTVFTLEYSVKLSESIKSTKAAFVFGANDKRLLDKNKNLYGIEAGYNESYIATELDITPVQSGEKALLQVFRVNYAPQDNKDLPLFSFPLPEEWINKQNAYETHTFKFQIVYGIVDVFFEKNGKWEQLTIPEGSTAGGWGAKGFNLNPNGVGGDYICYPALADIGFLSRSGQSARFSDIVVRNYRIPSNPLFKKDEIIINGDVEDSIATFDPSQNAIPMLRTTFTTKNLAVKKARLHVTARGIYEVFLNGEKVSDDYFNPGFTQYNRHHMYQTYDVTSMIKNNGHNAFGAWMGEGWWSGPHTFMGQNWNFFGDRQSLLAKLVITYSDGSTQQITTNEKDWKIFTDGPLRYGSFFQGEVYDAGKDTEIEGWTRPTFDDRNWEPASVIELEGTAVVGDYGDFLGRRMTMPYDNWKLIPQFGNNARVVMSLQPQKVVEVRPGVFVYDMGQNMVGVPEIKLRAPNKGDTIYLRYAEVTYPNLEEYRENEGMIMLENIRAAYAQDIYITKGEEEEIIRPRFTFHGFRFLEITGISEAIPVEDIQGKVISSIEHLDSHFETSNPLINKLWKNITWSLRGNFLSIPTDTPARNERMGWNGDINVFAPAALWLDDVHLFLNRHLMAIRDMQDANGRYSDVAPVGNGFGGILWGSAGITIPWELYLQYGNSELLKEHYPSMKAYMSYLEQRVDESGITLEGPLGDWLSPENQKNDNAIFWNAYHIRCLDIMSETASVLGYEKEAEIYENEANQKRLIFDNLFLDSETGKTIKSGIVFNVFSPPSSDEAEKGKIVDTQASYAIPLAMQVWSNGKREKIEQHLVNTVERPNIDDSETERPPFALMTGFIGTAAIGTALSEADRHDLVYRMLENEQYPSWLYPVKNGATTIWERLNSYTHEDGFGGNNSMNSFNHYSFGAIATWMYNYALGIRRNPEYPGFKVFNLAPIPDPEQKISNASGFYISPYGKIESKWEIEEEGIRYSFAIPANSSAMVKLPSSSFDQFKALSPGNIKLKDVNWSNGFITFTLPSGNYVFFVNKLKE